MFCDRVETEVPLHALRRRDGQNHLIFTRSGRWHADSREHSFNDLRTGLDCSNLIRKPAGGLLCNRAPIDTSI